MSASKSKSPQPKLPDSPFFKMAVKAMRLAQRDAARENARYGLPLIVERARR